MGFLDSIVDIFTGDVFFPDNPKRARRVQELEWDCNEFIRETRALSDDLLAEIATLDQTLQAAYADLNMPPVLAPIKEISPEPFERLPRLFSPLLAPIVCDGCRLSVELGRGANTDRISRLIGMSIFDDGSNWVFGIPKDLLVFGPEAGYRRRDRLRAAIQSARDARFRLRLMLTATAALLEQVKTVHLVFDQSRSLVDENALLENLANTIRSFQQSLLSLDARTAQWLSDYDAFRNSWTAEG